MTHGPVVEILLLGLRISLDSPWAHARRGFRFCRFANEPDLVPALHLSEFKLWQILQAGLLHSHPLINRASNHQHNQKVNASVGSLLTAPPQPS